MYEHFREKFPKQIAEINLLTRVNETLRTVLEDYEELCTWLAVQDRLAPQDRDELDKAQRLARELENEILQQLEKQDDSKT